MSSVLAEGVKLLMAIEELKAVAYSLRNERDMWKELHERTSETLQGEIVRLQTNLNLEKEYRSLDQEYFTYRIRYWSKAWQDQHLELTNAKRKEVHRVKTTAHRR